MAHPWENDFRTELDRIGEAEVRTRLARGEFGMVGSSRSMFVNEWLHAKESERRSNRKIKALSISEEANSISRKADSMATEALSNSREATSISRVASAASRRANIIALIAMICSVIAIITAAMIGLYR